MDAIAELIDTKSEQFKITLRDEIKSQLGTEVELKKLKLMHTSRKKA